MVRSSAAIPAPDAGRLDAKSWTDEALDLLAEQGIDGVRVEPLAKRLGVTKGSFYWHFKNRDELFQAMLAQWRQRATLEIIDRLERQSGDAKARLRYLLRLPFRGLRADRGAEVELSIRLWGRRDVRARAALGEVDRLRLRYIEKQFAEAGLEERDAKARAVHVYAFMRVANSLIDPKDTQSIEDCILTLVP